MVYPVCVLLGMLLQPDSSSQWEFSLLFFLSLFVMAWCGHLVLHSWTRDGVHVRQSFFLKAFLGQFALLLAWLALSPFVFLLRRVSGDISFPFVAGLLLLGTVLLAKPARITFVETLRAPEKGSWWFVIFAAACLFKVGSYFSAKAGALGLDTHQHIYYTVDLFDAGYLKIAAGSTHWIDRYPKGLHALAALWGLPGGGDYLGVFLKIMPSLQLLLLLFSIAELCAVELRHAKDSPLPLVVWQALVIAGLAYMLFRGMRFVYPVMDLNSTARLSSSGALFLPAVLGWIAVSDQSRKAIALAGFTLPVAAALVLKLNPTLFTAFAAVSVPAWAASAGLLVCVRQKALRPAALLGFLLGLPVSAVLVATDPFYLATLMSMNGSIASVVEWATGLAVLPQAVVIAPAPVSTLVANMWSTFPSALIASGGGLASSLVPGGAMVISGKMLAALRWLVFFSLTVWLINRLIRRQGVPLAAAMPAILQAVLLLGAWGCDLAARIVPAVLGYESLEASVVSTYVREFPNIFALFTLPLHLILSLALIAQVGASFFRELPGRTLLLWAPVGCALLIIASLRWWPIPQAPSAGALGWWVPVKESQVDEFQELEEKVPEDAVILAEATAVTLNGRENWILPVGQATSYLPFARRDYLFNVRLGRGYALSHSDLEQSFCKGSPATARRFLRDNSVNFIFTVDAADESPEKFLGRDYCGIKFSELGVVYPAYANTTGGLAMHQIRAER